MNAAEGRLNAMPEGFSAVSMEELEHIDGGLVVIACIVTLMGLLLPAINKE